jgi:hypothetical protein
MPLPPVYSKRFAGGTILGTSTNKTYTVPTGKVAVVRTVTAAGNGAWSGLVDITGIGWMTTFSGASGFSSYVWRGDVVLNAGEVVTGVWVAGVFYFTLSGFIFNA